jgi:hypothetical protein
MADWVTYDNDTGRVETHVMDKLGSVFRSATGSLHNISENTKEDPNSAMMVGGVGGLVGFTLGFWGIKMMLEKVGMDGFFGNVFSLVGAITLGLAVFDLLSNKNADARAINARREWADAHPQQQPPESRKFNPENDSLAAEMNRKAGIATGRNDDAGPEIKHPFADKNADDGFNRARRNNRELFSPAPGAPSNVEVTVEPSINPSSPAVRLPGIGGP